MPPKALLLGQDRERRGATALVGGDHVGELHVVADHARRRRAALVLGDHAQLRARERGGELADRVLRQPCRGGGLDDLDRRLRATALELGARAGDDRVERVHGDGASSCVTVTNRSSVAAAAPDSIACSAARTPSTSDGAAPPA